MAHNFNLWLMERSNTCRLLGPFHRWKSLRLFLEEDTEAGVKSVPDLQTRVPIRITAHPACLAIHEWSTHSVALSLLPFRVSSNRSTTSCTGTTGILGAHPTRENTSIIGLILGVIEDAAFHPERAFAIASTAVLAFAGLEVPQVLKHEDACSMLLCKLDNAAGDQVS